MKALVCRKFAPLDALRVEEVAEPVAAPGQLVLDIKAASVNYPDALIVQGKYQTRPELPFTPGFECAGVVTAVGQDCPGLAVGTRAVGLTVQGAFAERVALPAASVVPIGDSLSFDRAAAMPMTYGTVYHALKDRAKLEPRETLLVLGAAGGIGTAAVEIGRLMGARVIAAASSPEKLDVARRAGADQTILYSEQDWRDRLREIAGPEGVDVVCDPVGGAFTEPAFRSTAWGGRYLVIGFAAGEIPRLPLNLPLLKGSSIVGAYWGEFRRRDPGAAFAELRWLLDQAAAGRLQPIVSERYPLADSIAALQAVYGRRAKGKLVIEP